MRSFILLILVSLTLVHCTHAPKNLDSEGIPESCRSKNLSEDPNSHEPSREPENLMMSAIFQKDPYKLKELISSGQDIHKTDSFGLSLLHLAAAMDVPEMIEMLIQAGIPVNSKMGLKGFTPAHSAVSWGNVSALQALIRHGADLEIANADGKTPETLARDLNRQEVIHFFQNQKKIQEFQN